MLKKLIREVEEFGKTPPFCDPETRPARSGSLTNSVAFCFTLLQDAVLLLFAPHPSVCIVIRLNIDAAVNELELHGAKHRKQDRRASVES